MYVSDFGLKLRSNLEQSSRVLDGLKKKFVFLGPRKCPWAWMCTMGRVYGKKNSVRQNVCRTVATFSPKRGLD